MLKVIHTNIKDRISNLKASLLFDFPFFGHFLSNTEIIEDSSIPTISTNGVRIYYNPDFFDKLSDIELKAVWIHECLHMVYSHCDKKRYITRNRKKWNIATDYVINLEISELDPRKIKLPSKILINEKEFKPFLDQKYKNMYAEQVYDLLPDNILDEKYFDIHLDMPEDEDIVQTITDRIISSYEISKHEIGKLPLGILRVVKDMRSSNIPWTRIFQRYIGSALTRDDYSYSYPNRRFIGQDLYMPNITSNRVGKIGVFPDTSGSMNEKEISAFATELRKLSGLVSEIIVGCWDTKVHTWETIKDMSNIENALKFKGGGGTNNNTVWEEIKKRHETFDAIILFTDGMFGKLPKMNPLGNIPIIFVLTSDIHIDNNFGLIVRMKVDK